MFLEGIFSSQKKKDLMQLQFKELFSNGTIIDSKNDLEATPASLEP
jgi:hypothetical protein